MELQNKLGLSGIEFLHEEERLSKIRAKRLFDERIVYKDEFEADEFAAK